MKSARSFDKRLIPNATLDHFFDNDLSNREKEVFDAVRDSIISIFGDFIKGAFIQASHFLQPQRPVLFLPGKSFSLLSAFCDNLGIFLHGGITNLIFAVFSTFYILGEFRQYGFRNISIHCAFSCIALKAGGSHVTVHDHWLERRIVGTNLKLWLVVYGSLVYGVQSNQRSILVGALHCSTKR